MDIVLGLFKIVTFLLGLCIMNAIIVGVMSLFTGPGKSAVPVTKNDEQMKKLLGMPSDHIHKPVTLPEYLQMSTKREIKNVSVHKNPMWWFVDSGKVPEPSPAESLIIDILNKYNVVWEREVSFYGLQINKWSYPRYDFLIQVPVGVGIHIIEYDGQLYHQSEERIKVDKIKDKFCKENNIPLTRYNKKHYYKLNEYIHRMLSDYGIMLK